MSKEITVSRQGELLEYLIEAMPNLSRKKVKELLEHKSIIINGKIVTQFNYRLLKGQKITVDRQNKYSLLSKHNITIIHEDDELIIINKPYGLLSVANDDAGKPTVFSVISDYVKISNPQNRVYIVHRLDRDTSGVLMLSKNEGLKIKLQDNWNALVKKRLYYAVCEGVFEKKQDSVTTYLEEDKNNVVFTTQDPTAQKAVTDYKVIKEGGGYSLLDISIKTGKKNQIRVCMKSLGHPAAGDKKYGSGKSIIKRLALHAYLISFVHPVTDELITFNTDMPKDFNKFF